MNRVRALDACLGMMLALLISFVVLPGNSRTQALAAERNDQSYDHVQQGLSTRQPASSSKSFLSTIDQVFPAAVVTSTISARSFKVGVGYTDVMPRQMVRTHDDQVYIFAGQAQGSNNILVYWTTVPVEGMQPPSPATETEVRRYFVVQTLTI